MSEDLQAREEELVRLLAATRRAVTDGAGQEEVRRLRSDSERAFALWRNATSLVLHRAIEQPASLPERTVESDGQAPRTIREKVRAALLILGAPAIPALLSDVYEAFHNDVLAVRSLRQGSLRESERNSHQVSQRAWFVCPVLTSDLQAAPRYYALSTWPMEQRIMTHPSAQLWQLQAVAGLAATVHSHLDQGRTVSPAALQLLRATAVSAGLQADDQTSVEAIEAQAHRRMAPLLDEQRVYSAEVVGRAEALPEAGRLFGKAAVRLNHTQTAALWEMARASAERVEAMDAARPTPAAAAPSPAAGPAAGAQASAREDPSPQPGRSASAAR